MMISSSARCKNCFPRGIILLRILQSKSYNFTPPYNESTLASSSDRSGSELTREIRRRYENSQSNRKKKSDRERRILSQIESIAAQQYLKSDTERFSKIEERTRSIISAMHKPPETSIKKKLFLPLNAKQNPEIFTNIPPNELPNCEENDDLEDNVDRGFFISTDEYLEDYSPATTAEMPEDEMTEPSIQYYGNMDDAVEDIEFQLPGQASKPKDESVKLDGFVADIGDWASDYGTSHATQEQLDELSELKDAKCAGCGAQFHCHNPSLPGFVPLEMFREIEKNSKNSPLYQKTDYACRRCYLLKEYNFLLNLNVCEVDYAAIMGHLKTVQEALILLIVDMTDLQGSIHKEISKIIGTHKPLIVIGNKVDLLPPDTRRGFLHHYHDCLRKAVTDAGISTNFNVLKYILVSAKTGFGIEDLITNIYQHWIGPRGVLRNDMYVVGPTNAGKSTLFNAFLQSDLCKVRAMDLVERVTTSIWPGTTLSLLKFPLMNPAPQKLELRRRRLLSMQAWAKKEEQIRRAMLRKTNDPRYMVMQGHVGSTFKEREKELQPISTTKLIRQFNGELTPDEELEELKKEKKNNLSLNDRVFQKGNWCYDTPGTVNSQQILDLFTLGELINIIPRSIVLPRIFILFPGQSVLLGAVASLDILKSSGSSQEMMPIYMSVFASQHLKVSVVATKYVNDFMQNYRGDASLGAPIGDADRLKSFPRLEGRKFDIKGGRKMIDGGIADIVLSSLGWALVTTEADSVKINASTPAGRGLFLRQPPLIPYAADYRENRIKGTAQYTTRSLVDIENSYELTRKGRNIGRRNIEVDSSDNEPNRFVNFDLA